MKMDLLLEIEKRFFIEVEVNGKCILKANLTMVNTKHNKNEKTASNPERHFLLSSKFF